MSGIPALLDVSRVLAQKSTFQELLSALDSHVFLKYQPESNGQAIDKLYKWLAMEVIKVSASGRCV